MSEIRIQEVQEGAQLMDKLVELLKPSGHKMVLRQELDAADLAILDKRINESRPPEGWELVTYDLYGDLHAASRGRL